MLSRRIHNGMRKLRLWIQSWLFPVLSTKPPYGFKFSSFDFSKDHYHQEIHHQNIDISYDRISIKRTRYLYTASNIYEKPEIVDTLQKEEIHTPTSKDLRIFWKALKRNRFAYFPSANYHLSPHDNYIAEKQFVLTFNRASKEGHFDITDSYILSYEGIWLKRIENIEAAIEELVLNSKGSSSLSGQPL